MKWIGPTLAWVLSLALVAAAYLFATIYLQTPWYDSEAEIVLWPRYRPYLGAVAGFFVLAAAFLNPLTARLFGPLTSRWERRVLLCVVAVAAGVGLYAYEGEITKRAYANNNEMMDTLELEYRSLLGPFDVDYDPTGSFVQGELVGRAMTAGELGGVRYFVERGKSDEFGIVEPDRIELCVTGQNGFSTCALPDDLAALTARGASEAALGAALAEARAALADPKLTSPEGTDKLCAPHLPIVDHDWRVARPGQPLPTPIGALAHCRVPTAIAQRIRH